MKQLNNYIIEKLHLNNDIKFNVSYKNFDDFINKNSLELIDSYTIKKSSSMMPLDYPRFTRIISKNNLILNDKLNEININDLLKNIEYDDKISINDHNTICIYTDENHEVMWIHLKKDDNSIIYTIETKHYDYNKKMLDNIAIKILNYLYENKFIKL